MVCHAGVGKNERKCRFLSSAHFNYFFLLFSLLVLSVISAFLCNRQHAILLYPQYVCLQEVFRLLLSMASNRISYIKVVINFLCTHTPTHSKHALSIFPLFFRLPFLIQTINEYFLVFFLNAFF